MSRSAVALAITWVLGASLTGCATTWIITQAAGRPGAWDEGVREATVPLPGVVERLAVKLPLAIEYRTVETPVAPGASGTPATATSSVAEPFALACSTDQQARDVVYHSAFRYGSRWKWMSGVMALVEGGLATALLLGRSEHPEYVIYGGYFGLDALITAGLFFLPRKEIYRKDEHPSVTHVRSDCPEGMTLAIGQDRFPVDAAGGIGEVGEVALDAWMSAPTGPLQLEAAGQARRFEIGQGEQCTWMREHHPESRCLAGVALRSVLVAIEVPAGTLSGVPVSP